MNVADLVRLALQEDLGPGDLTSTATIAPNTHGVAYIDDRPESVELGPALASAGG